MCANWNCVLPRGILRTEQKRCFIFNLSFDWFSCSEIYRYYGRQREMENSFNYYGKFDKIPTKWCFYRLTFNNQTNRNVRKNWETFKNVALNVHKYYLFNIWLSLMSLLLVAFHIVFQFVAQFILTSTMQIKHPSSTSVPRN